VPGAVAVGTVLAVAADRAIDETGVVGTQAVVADPETIQHARPEGLQQHVGIAGEPQQNLCARV